MRSPVEHVRSLSRRVPPFRVSLRASSQLVAVASGGLNDDVQRGGRLRHGLVLLHPAGQMSRWQPLEFGPTVARSGCGYPDRAPQGAEADSRRTDDRRVPATMATQGPNGWPGLDGHYNAPRAWPTPSWLDYLRSLGSTPRSFALPGTPLGPSRSVLWDRLVTGSMIAATILPLAGADGSPARAVALASMLAILVGATMILAGVAKVLGFVADLLSKPTRSAT